MSRRFVTASVVLGLLLTSATNAAHAAPTARAKPRFAAAKPITPQVAALPVATPIEAPPAPEVISNEANEAPLPPPDGVVQKRIAITLNPLPMAVGRFGGNVEVLVATHHAVGGSVYVQTFPTWLVKVALPSTNIGGGPAPLFGGELGYRYYTGRGTASGFFVGPSFVAMPLAYPRVTENLDAQLASFHAYGGAVDFGGQLVTSSGFTIGGGLGVMALAYTPPASVAPPPGTTVPDFPEPHVLPRLLFSAGWAF